MMEAHEVLARAKGYLLTHGWQQGIGGDGGPRCMVGAICSVERRHGLPECRSAELALVATIGGPISIGWWNDEPGRTFDEVIAAFDAAIIQTAPKDTPAPQPETPSPSVAHVFA